MSFDKELPPSGVELPPSGVERNYLPPSGVERNYFYPMGQLDINHVTCDPKDKYCQVYELCHLKTCLRFFLPGQHKPGCTTTEDD